MALVPITLFNAASNRAGASRKSRVTGVERAEQEHASDIERFYASLHATGGADGTSASFLKGSWQSLDKFRNATSYRVSEGPPDEERLEYLKTIKEFERGARSAFANAFFT